MSKLKEGAGCRAGKLREASERASELRRDFIENYSVAEAKKHHKEIVTKFLFCVADNATCIVDNNNFCASLGCDPEGLYAEFIYSNPEYAFFRYACMALCDDEEDYCYWNGVYRENEELDALYDFLCALGYTMSDEEKALQDGTSDLFVLG